MHALCVEHLALAYGRIIFALTGCFQIRIASVSAARSSRTEMVTAAVAGGAVSANGHTISGPYISAHRTASLESG